MKIWKLIIFFISTINFEETAFLYIHIYTRYVLYVCIYIFMYIDMCIYIYIYSCFLSSHVLQLSISNSLHFANVSFSKQTNPPVVSVRRASSRHQLGQKSNFGRNLAPTWRLLCVGTWANRGRRCLNWLSVLAYSWDQRYRYPLFNRIPGRSYPPKKIRVYWNWHHTPCH